MTVVDHVNSTAGASRHAAPEDVALTMEDVSKIFLPKRGGAVLAMTEVSLDVRRNEVLAILGPSGCGKSTLLRIIGGLDSQSEGSIHWTQSQQETGRLDAATVFQQDSTLPWLTVAQNIRLGLSGLRLSKTARNERVDRYAKLVGLHAFLAAYPHELSGGMRQRVAIARALASEPRLLLMDEPLAALDAQTRIVMQSELSTLWGRTGSTVVYVTHDIEEAITLADRIVVMSARPGRIKSVRTVDFRPGARGEVDPVALRAIPDFGRLAAELWADLAEEVGQALSAKEIS